MSKSERVLVTGHAASSLNVTVSRSFDSDTALTFSADDYLMIFAMEEHIEEGRKAIAQALFRLDQTQTRQHAWAEDSGSGRHLRHRSGSGGFRVCGHRGNADLL